jgi:hypothetical protein
MLISCSEGVCVIERCALLARVSSVSVLCLSPLPRSGLVRIRPEPRGWDSPHVLWRSRDNPDGEPLFSLEDMAEGGALGLLRAIPLSSRAVAADSAVCVADELPSVAQVRAFFSRVVSSFSRVFSQCLMFILPIQELEARSLGKSMFLRREWDV